MKQIPTALARVWAAIPDAGCKGLCIESCGPVGGSPVELALLAERGVSVRDPFAALRDIALGMEPETCPALVDGRCSVYEVRPTVCRLWGSIEDMPCPFGCEPVVGRLSSALGRTLLAAAMEARA